MYKIRRIKRLLKNNHGISEPISYLLLKLLCILITIICCLSRIKSSHSNKDAAATNFLNVRQRKFLECFGKILFFKSTNYFLEIVLKTVAVLRRYGLSLENTRHNTIYTTQPLTNNTRDHNSCLLPLQRLYAN